MCLANNEREEVFPSFQPLTKREISRNEAGKLEFVSGSITYIITHNESCPLLTIKE